LGQHVGDGLAPTRNPRGDRPDRDIEALCDGRVRESFPVEELERHARSFGQSCEGAAHAVAPLGLEERVHRAFARVGESLDEHARLALWRVRNRSIVEAGAVPSSGANRIERDVPRDPEKPRSCRSVGPGFPRRRTLDGAAKRFLGDVVDVGVIVWLTKHGRHDGAHQRPQGRDLAFDGGVDVPRRGRGSHERVGRFEQCGEHRKGSRRWGPRNFSARADFGVSREIRGLACYVEGVNLAEASTPKKRPLYLLAALALCFALGTGGWVGGCETIAYYHSDPALARYNAPLKDESERPRLDEATDRWMVARDASKKQAFPLGVAAFVLGAALLSLAARGLAGKPGGRSALVQVVSVQAAIALVTFVATKDVRWAEREVYVANMMGNAPKPFPTREERDHQERFTRAFLTFLSPAALGVRTLLALLVVFALTRPRARELLEPASAEE
jgi:hypothetical protein